MITFQTAGESHGKAVAVILNGIPAGLKIDFDFIDKEMMRRQHGYGRGQRMKIEPDKIEFFSGIRHGKTLGSPIGMMIENKDHAKWLKTMNTYEIDEEIATVTIPRPGHADLVGLQKYAHEDIRNVIERSSARETSMRVAMGTICKLFLKEFGINIVSYVKRIGSVETPVDLETFDTDTVKHIEDSPVRTTSPEAEQQMIELIDKAKEAGDTLGGAFRVTAFGLPPGLGSYINWDAKLDGALARALMSVPSCKGVEIGAAVGGSGSHGSNVHDPIIRDADGMLTRETNNAGGLEGGVTNGMPLTATVYMKPISTLKKGLKTINLATNEEIPARYERSDVTVVPAGGVIGETMMAYVLADAFVKKFGGDSVVDIKVNFNNYLERVKKL